MCWRFWGRNVARELRLVMRSVFDGGEGVTNGGRAERSRESGVWEPSDSEVDVGLADGEAGGDLSWADMDRVV